MQGLYVDSLARTSFVLVMLTIAGGMALLLGTVLVFKLDKPFMKRQAL